MPPPRARPVVDPTALRAPLFAALLIVASLAGCTDGCSPVEVPTQVALGLVDEEARTLPILASGATTIAGQDVPDAHGRLEFRLDVTHVGLDNASLAFEDITISGLRLQVEVGGRALPVEIVQIDGGSSWRAVGDRWHGAGVNGSRITIWWTVEFDPARDPLALALPEGEPYVARVDFDWSHRDCYARASGHRAEETSDFIEASVNARTFEPTRAPRLEFAAGGVGLDAEYRIRSGLNATIRSIEARAVRFGPPAVEASVNASGEGDLGVGPTGAALTGAVEGSADIAAPSLGLALVAFPQLAAFTNGARAEAVSPAAPVQVLSVGASADAYATTGAMLPAAFPPGPAVYVLTVRITYEPSDPTLGTTTDVFASAIVQT